MTEPEHIPAGVTDPSTTSTESLPKGEQVDTGADPYKKDKMPGALICVPIAYLLLLGLSAWIFRGNTQDILWVSIPLAAIWFGALGGVVSSLQGMFLYRFKWAHRFDLWHVFSGIVGAVYGIISFLFLVVIMKAAATNVTPDLNSPVFALGAFAIGYGQSHFHGMMDKVFTALFSESKKPGDDTTNKNA